MAILMKEKIENKALSNEERKQNKRKAHIIKADNLRFAVLNLESDCTDLYDTFKYCKEHMIELNQPIRGSGLYSDYRNKIAFSYLSSNIEYFKGCDHQTLGYNGKNFYIKCVSSFNGHKEEYDLNDVNFNLQNDYYIDEAIDIMANFFNLFPSFKADFIEKLDKATK